MTATSHAKLLALFVAVTLLIGAQASNAAAFETSAKEVILVDDTTGAVLLAKNSDRRMFPASMSKLMTLYVVFSKLTEGSLSLDDQLRVSEKAWRMGGSKMFVELNSRVSVNELLRGIIVQSGNDACIVLAEGIAGTEAQFVELMNAAAKKLALQREWAERAYEVFNEHNGLASKVRVMSPLKKRRKR